MAAITQRAGWSTTSTVDAALAAPASVPLLLAAFALAAVAQGAHYRDAQVGVAALIAAAVVAGGLGPLRQLASGPARGLAAFAFVLAVWSVVSAAANGRVTAALPVVALVGGVVAAVAIAASASDQDRVALVGGLLAVGGGVALTGWVGVAVRVSPWAHVDQGLWRAATTLTYANAAAGLLGPLALVASARQIDRDTVTSRVITFALLVGVAATVSRAGLLATAGGFVLLAVLLGFRRTLRVLAPPALGAAVALAALLPSLPATSGGRPVLATAGLVVGAVIAVRVRRTPTLVVVFGAGVALAGVLLLGPAGGSAIGQRAVHAVTTGRATLDSADRVHEARAALRLAGAHPLTGMGPRGARLTWTEPGGRRLFDAYAHNEYLQVLVDLGTPGFVVLLSMLAAVGWVLRGARRWVPAPAWAGVASGLAALAVHSGFDFLWHIPVIPLMAAALIGAVLGKGGEHRTHRNSPAVL